MLKKIIFLTIFILTCYGNETSNKLEDRFKKHTEAKSSMIQKEKPIKITDFDIEKAKKVKFTIKSLQIQKSNVFSNEDFYNHFQNLFNKQITLYDLINSINQLTQKYYQKGYAFSRAYLPANQEISLNSSNIITIHLIEPFLDNAINNINDKRMLISKIKNKFFPKKEINIQNLENFLSLTKKLKGVPNLIMDKSDQLYASSFVADKELVSGFISVDNRGTKAVGKYQIVTGLSIKNPFGYLSNTDLLYARSFDSKELNYFSFTNNQLINDSGLNFSINTTYSDSEPDNDLLRNVNQESKSKSLNLKLNKPIINSRSKNLEYSLKLDMRNSESYSLDSRILEDRTRILRFELNYDFANDTSINQIILEYSKGLTILGSMDNNSNLKSREDGKINFDKLNIFLSRTQSITNKFSLYGAISGQFSADPLLSSEECGVGGKRFGRAYDSSEITGDSCYAASIEARYMIDEINQYQTYLFYDIGKAKNKKTASSDLKDESIASIGLGLRLYPSKKVYASFEIAKPLSKIVTNENDKDTRLFASLTYRF